MDEIILEKPKQREIARLLTPSGPQELSVTAVAGETVQQLIDRAIPEELKGYIVAFNRGTTIADPSSFYIQEDDSIMLAVIPQGGGGGKGILGTVLAIAVMVAAPYATAALAPTLGFAATGLTASLVTVGISMLGMMAISALIPPPDVPNSGGSSVSPTYSLGGTSNAIRKYQPVARIYGRHKVFPQLASTPLVTNLGTDSSLAALYDFGLGDIEVTDLKIGDTLASTYEPEMIWHKNSLVENTTYLTQRVGYDQYSYVLKSKEQLIVRTKQATTAFDVELTFPRGLGYFNDQGNVDSLSIYVNAQYRLVGETIWRDIPASAFRGITAWEQSDPPPPEVFRKFNAKAWTGDPDQRIGLSNNTSQRFIAVVSVTPPEVGEFEFRIIKGSAETSENKYLDEVALTTIKSYKDGSVVALDKRHTMLEMRVKATDKLSGTIQTLNGIASSVLRTTEDGITFANKATSNPAWIVLDILTGEGNKRPIPDDLIDWQSFIRLANWCDKNKYYANFVVDYSTTVQSLVTSVLSLCHASMLFTTSGKYGILIDEERDTPRQLITPANSWGFKGSRSFADVPHGLYVTFINGEASNVIVGNAPEINWQKEERIVYNDGYDETNATVFETLDTFGITNPDQAWKYGRFMLAQGILRSEVFTVNMDVENIVVQRGDLVHVANDVARVGGMAARIVSVDRDTNTVTIDQTLSLLPSGYSFRSDGGDVRTGKVITSTSTEEGTTLIVDSAAIMTPGDLIVLGQTDRVIGKYIVQQIIPSSDLTAELTLVKYVPEVYKAETGEIPPWNPDLSEDQIGTTDLHISRLDGKYTSIYINRKPFAAIQLDWSVGGYGYFRAEIWMKVPGKSPQFLGDTQSFSYEYLIDVLANEQLIDIPLTFEVIPFTAGGVAGRSAEITLTVGKDVTPPADIEGFTVNVQSETVQISWNRPVEEDIDYYEIRYTPEVINPQWDFSQFLATAPFGATTIQVGARTGTYMMRVYDTSGNMSNVIARRTTVVSLPNTELITEIDDRWNLWPGTLYKFGLRTVGRNPMISEWEKLSYVPRMDEIGGGVGDLISAGPDGEVEPFSTYTFKDIVDFTDIYEARLYSKIVAHGEYTSGAIAPTELWDAYLEYRVTGNIAFISDWDLLSNQVDMIGTSASEWGFWRSLTVGDVTAKLIQFRIVGKSYDPNVRVVVTSGFVIIDAMDRMYSKYDIELPQGLTRIYFDPPFMFDNVSVAISIDGDDTPLISRVTNKNRLGCDVELRHAVTDTPETGKIDLVVRGQGKEVIVDEEEQRYLF
jgi:hypothetical protein